MQGPADVAVPIVPGKLSFRTLATRHARQILFRHVPALAEVIFSDVWSFPGAVSAAAIKSYRKPTVSKITLAQAKLTVIGHATIGHEGARDLMELIFNGAVFSPVPVLAEDETISF